MLRYVVCWDDSPTVGERTYSRVLLAVDPGPYSGYLTDFPISQDLTQGHFIVVQPRTNRDLRDHYRKCLVPLAFPFLRGNKLISANQILPARTTSILFTHLLSTVPGEREFRAVLYASLVTPQYIHTYIYIYICVCVCVCVCVYIYIYIYIGSRMIKVH